MIDQNISLDILAQTIINSVMKNTFEEFFKSSTDASADSTQMGVAEGMPDIFKSIGMIIGGIVALIVVLIILYMVFKSSGSTKPMPPQGGTIPFRRQPMTSSTPVLVKPTLSPPSQLPPKLVKML